MRRISIIISLFAIFVHNVGMAADTKYLPEEKKIVINGATVILKSSETLLHNGKTTRYSLANLSDANLKTAWVTRYTPDDYLRRGRLTIEFQKPIYIKTLKIANGCQKSQSTYNNNQRVKNLNILSYMGSPGFDEGSIYEIKDTKGWQEIDISNANDLFATKTILIDIYDVYPGAKHNDLCISGLSFTYSNKSTYKATQKWETLKAKILANRTVTERGWHWEKFYAVDSNR